MISNLVYTIKESINEKREEIKQFLVGGGNYLITSSTGLRKTSTLINICQEILKEDKKNRYVVLFVSPTNIQALQNTNNYNTNGIKNTFDNLDMNNVNTLVFDKIKVFAKELKKAKQRLILIIDEAHELVYANNYRSYALDLIKRVSSIAKTVVHVTATPRSLQFVYKYNNILEFRQDRNTNNRVTKFYLEEEHEDILLNKLINEDKKFIVMINNKRTISKINKIVKRTTKKKIVTLTSADKENENFTNLVLENKLCDDVDIVLCTSVLNDGINILNKDFELIMYVDNKAHFNLDTVKQFIGRLRDNNTILHVITKEEYYDYVSDTYKDVDVLRNKQVATTNKSIGCTNRYMDEMAEYEGLSLITNSSFITFVTSSLDVKINDNLDLKVDRISMISKVINRHDRQLILNKDFAMRNSNIIGNIIETKVEIIKNIANVDNVENVDKDKKEEIKEVKKQVQEEIKEAKKQERRKDAELIKTINTGFSSLTPKEKMLFIQLITYEINNVNYKLINDYIKRQNINLQGELYHLYQLISSSEKMLKKYKSINTHYGFIPNIVQIYIENKHNMRELKGVVYKYLNKHIKIENTKSYVRKIKNEYLNIRSVLDSYIQKKLTKRVIVKLFNLLTPLSKQIKDFKEITNTLFKSLLNKIKLVYKLCINKNTIQISSLLK